MKNTGKFFRILIKAGLRQEKLTNNMIDHVFSNETKTKNTRRRIMRKTERV
jgi:hypothetical protein